MTTFEAIQIIEGLVPDQPEERINEAWQTLVDTGVVWRLQGWYGRTAAAMIEEGILTRAESPCENHDHP